MANTTVKKKYPFLPPDVASKLGTGWYEPSVTDPNLAKYTGSPVYAEEEQYILDYMARNGRRPTSSEVKQWMDAQDMERFNYNPGSTMYEMGYRTPGEYSEAQRMGLTYGPWGGEQIPYGSTVYTGAGGEPYMRSYGEPSDLAQALQAKGQYIPKDLPGKATYRGKYLEDFYPEKQAKATFIPTSMEDLMQRTNPQEVYIMQLNDYLANKIRSDTRTAEVTQGKLDILRQESMTLSEQADELAARYSAETDAKSRKIIDDALAVLSQRQEGIDTAAQELLAGMEDIMTPQKALEIQKEAVARLRPEFGFGLEELPLFNEVKGAKGKNIADWYTANLQSEEQAFKEQQAEEREIRTRVPSTAQEKQPFAKWVLSLGAPADVEQWLYSNYQSLYQVWYESNTGQSFLQWLESYLGG